MRLTTPIGTAMAAARPVSISVPMMALRMPPPSSPTGRGSWIKKSRLSDWMPWLMTKNMMKASGTSASTTDSAQAATNSDDRIFRGAAGRGAEGVGGFTLGHGHRLQDLARNRGGEGDNHDREDEPGGEHPHAERRPGKERGRPHGLGRPRLQHADERHEHEDAPQAVHDRGNGREQLRQKDQRRAEDRRGEGPDADRETQHRRARGHDRDVPRVPHG